MHVALVQNPVEAGDGAGPDAGTLARHLEQAGHAVTLVASEAAARAPEVARVVRLGAYGLGGPWRAWAFASAVERHLESARYDLVLGLGGAWSQDVLRMGGGCLASSRPADPTDAPWRRVLEPDAAARWVALAIERRALRPGACRRVIAGSMRVREDVLTRYGLAPEDVGVVYGGVDLQRFHPRLHEQAGAALRTRLGLTDEDLCLLFPGGDLARDGLDELLEAFALIAPVKPRTRLLVACDGPQRPRLEQRASELGIGERTRFLAGQLDLETCYGAADVSVLPTRSAAFARPTLEALAAGVPAITTCTDGAGELITPGLDGSILPRDRAAADLVQELLLWCEPGRARHGRSAARAVAELHGAARPLAETTAILEAAAGLGSVAPAPASSRGVR